MNREQSLHGLKEVSKVKMHVCSAREVIRLPKYLSHILRPIFSAETSAFRLRLREESHQYLRTL
jgi:hypothetical protein